MKNKPKQYPKCKSERIAEIQYGLPHFTTELERQIEIGGCIISDDSPQWHCSTCEHKWGKLNR